MICPVPDQEVYFIIVVRNQYTGAETTCDTALITYLYIIRSLVIFGFSMGLNFEEKVQFLERKVII